jgi:hypothetical protein
MGDIARLLADALLARRPPEAVRADVIALRRAFRTLHFVRE